MKKLHQEDRDIAYAFIDGVRIHKKVTVTLQILARHLAEHIGINPDQNNVRLANAIARAFETGKVA